MYKMFSIITLISLSLLLDFGGAQSGKCNNPPPSENFNEEDCLRSRRFYVYAASIPCENCCIIRELHLKMPGVLETAEFSRKGNEPAVNRTIMMFKKGNSPFYKIEDQENAGKFLTFYLVNGTDCIEKSFLYTKWDKALYVYTPNPNHGPDFLNNLRKTTIKGCDVKLYHYNPKDNC